MDVSSSGLQGVIFTFFCGSERALFSILFPLMESEGSFAFSEIEGLCRQLSQSAVRLMKINTQRTPHLFFLCRTTQLCVHSIHRLWVMSTSCLIYFYFYRSHLPPSQPIQLEEKPACLNLLFVMQVISEEGVSFKVSPPLLLSFLLCSSLWCLLVLVHIPVLSSCNVILWWVCLWLCVLPESFLTHGLCSGLLCL